MWFLWVNRNNWWKKLKWAAESKKVYRKKEEKKIIIVDESRKKKKRRRILVKTSAIRVLCHAQAPFTSGLCVRMCIQIFFKRFRMKVRPAPPPIPPSHYQCNKRKPSIVLSQSQPFDSITTDTITLTLSKSGGGSAGGGGNGTITAQPNKYSSNNHSKHNSFKLMRTPSHEKLMWQVVTVPAKLSDAFGSLMRYAQESINVFFCPT